METVTRASALVPGPVAPGTTLTQAVKNDKAFWKEDCVSALLRASGAVQRNFPVENMACGSRGFVLIS